MRSAKLTLYTRSSCSLCDEARRVIEDVKRRLASRTGSQPRGESTPSENVTASGTPESPVNVELELVDVALHPSLWERYRYDVPVVLLDGEVVFRHRVDPEALEKLLLQGGSPCAGQEGCLAAPCPHR